MNLTLKNREAVGNPLNPWAELRSARQNPVKKSFSLIDVFGVKKIGDNQLNIHDKSGSDKPMTKEDIISKLIDCCKE